MSNDNDNTRREALWAQLRFSIVGPLLAAPPGRGQLRAELERLSAKTWRHPISKQPVQFGVSTIEGWYYKARAERLDPVGVLGRKARRDRGHQHSVSYELRQAIDGQYRDHPTWSYQLHYDNLSARVHKDPQLGPLPSYATIRRFMKGNGHIKHKRRRRQLGVAKSSQKRHESFETREVRSFESEYVNALWHLDYHHGSRKVLSSQGEWFTPKLLAVVDDRSRLACHVQWYQSETAEELVHALCQAFMKRGLPRCVLTDNGSAMRAEEVEQGLTRLGIVHETTLPYSPHQNGKQEVFFAQVEGRLMAMLEAVEEVSLALLNEATQAWVEMEYQRKLHSETRQSPLERFLQGPTVSRDCPELDELRIAFTSEQPRRLRKTDGTVSIEGVRFELPSRFRHLDKLWVRYASWDLSHVFLIDTLSGKPLCRLYPLDKARNADKARRLVEPVELLSSAPQLGERKKQQMAPLLEKLMQDYAESGLPPAYLPFAKPTP
jgi:transposase InsO family protein